MLSHLVLGLLLLKCSAHPQEELLHEEGSIPHSCLQGARHWNRQWPVGSVPYEGWKIGAGSPPPMPLWGVYWLLSKAVYPALPTNPPPPRQLAPW